METSKQAGGTKFHSGRPQVKLRETAKSYYLTVEMPGLSKENIDIEAGVLTVTMPRERGGRSRPRVLRWTDRESAIESWGEPLSQSESDLLKAGGFDLEPRPDQEDPIEKTSMEYARLLAESLSTEHAGRLLNVDSSRIRQRLAERTLYGIRQRSRWLLPAFQFSDRGEVPGWGQVAPQLPSGIHPLAVENWFVEPSVDLIEPGSERRLSPKDWLRSGLPVEDVAQIASTL